jgi:predicted anti-sigma-YlaC factor YlaD
MALRDFAFRKIEPGFAPVDFTCDETSLNLDIAEQSKRVQIDEIITIGDHLSKCAACARKYGDRLFKLQKKLIAQTADDALLG